MRHFALFAARRLAFVPFAVLIVVTLSFFIVNLVPSDAAREKAGGLASEADVAIVKHQMGLDKDIWHRYADFMSNIFTHASLGRSFYSGNTVWSDVWLFLPSTIELIVLSLLIATVVGVGLGTLGAHFKERFPDVLVRGFITVTQAIPDFFLGLLLIFIVFYKAGWLPAPTGQLGLLDFPEHPVTHAVLFDAFFQGQWGMAGIAFMHAILPALTLGIFYSAYFAKTARFIRLVRAEALSLRESRFVEAAIAIGATRSRVMFRHLLPNTTNTILVQASLTAAQSIVVIASLAYLGIGIRPPKASWGAMIRDGAQGITTGDWWIAIFPGIAVFVCVLLFNQIADRLERVLSRGARG